MVKKTLAKFLCFTTVICIICGLGIMTVKADEEKYSGTCGPNVNWEYDEETKTLTFSGTGAMQDRENQDMPAEGQMRYSDIDEECVENVVIKSGITRIGVQAFEYYSNLKSVTIADTVTEIGDKAFRVSGIESIIIPDSVTEIGEGAFGGTNLKEITIPKNVKKIAMGTFAMCNKLTNVTIPENITEIEEAVFYQCENLTSVNILGSITKVPDYLFYECEKLTDVTLPDSVVGIEDHAFYGCKSLTHLEIPENVTYIEYDAFYKCGLTSITIPKGVTKLEDCIFCDSLTSITILGEVTEIKDYEFACLENLTDITLPDSITSIGEYAFWMDKKLTHIKIPKNVTKIGEYAFAEEERTTTSENKICVLKDSYAEQYAKDNNIDYEIYCIEHVLVKDVEVAPTCVKPGLTEGSHCSVCGNTIVEQKVIPAIGHSYGTWTTTRESTVFKTGIKKRVCSACGAIETKTIPKLTATIKLSKTKNTIKVGKSFTLTVSNLAKGDQIKTVVSSKSKIAKVKKIALNKYKVSGLKKGSVKITVTLKSGKKAVCNIVVK